MRRQQLVRQRVCALALGLWLAGLAASCDGRVAAESPPSKTSHPGASVQIAKREGKLRDYPCNHCHDKVAWSEAPGGRGPHTALDVQHFEAAEECGLCHDHDNMNRLRLLGERRVGFDDSHELCGQCHSEKLDDWRLGAHGKHVGSWQRDRYRLTCADCHDPHQPRRPTTRAQPAPPLPERSIPKEGHR